MARPSSLTSRLARALTRLALERPLVSLAAGLLITVAGVGLGAQLSLQTDLSELLPDRAESVVQLKALNKRVGGTGNVAIALTGEPAVLRAYIPVLVAALRAQLGPDLLAIKYKRKDVDDYYSKFGAYYVGLDELARWEERLREVVRDEKAHANPAYVDLGDERPHAAARQLIDDVHRSRQKVGPANVADPETGFLMTEGGHLAVLFVRPAANSLNLAGSAKMLERIRGIVDGTGAAARGVHLEGFTGSIPSAIVEEEAVKRDIASTAALVMLLVGGVVVLFFNSVRELVLMSAALLVGAAFAFAFAFLWIGHVNAQTAFLGSIIVGTGINYGIILLARYNELRREGQEFARALEESIATTLPATSIAAGATAISFGVLAAGTVESFHQFGWIGGLGILACWVATYTVVPSALVLFDQRRRYAPRRFPQPLKAACHRLADGIARAPRSVVVVCVLSTALALVATWHRRHDPLETNISKLGTKSTLTRGIQKLDARLRKMDTGSSTPAVIATGSREEANQVCGVLRVLSATTDHRFMNRCFTIDYWLPSDVDARVPLLAKLRADLDQVPIESLDAGDRKELDELRRQVSERPPAMTDLPPTLTEGFVERDGSIGKLAFLEPRGEEVAQNLFDFADAIRTISLPGGRVIRSSGENVVFADVLHAVMRDAKRLTIAAAALVLLLLLVLTRRAGPFFRVGLALTIGVAWMIGLAALFHLKLNFFNFVALPTTFGIGIDYAINVEERVRLRGVGALGRALGEVGPPVILASATTILGYVSLLTADNQALVSFGSLAILGEATCLLAALVLVPALWALKNRAALASGEATPGSVQTTVGSGTGSAR